ncbi:coiled-coil domain-containing protein 18 isoform X2 [Neltuma alba]|uniref:coiled-coil domain-containing protein 18 isoform X2 n=1 Tax=Neltuma alba TaxID=207710 RepID=UPI0010A48ED1|nr:coiled-coil domain-containing protein 18-like isoform X2 [Prosopis alba]
MSRITKWKIEKTKVKVVFRLQFHATHIPQSGWDKLFISFIPSDSGKAIAKTTKANVRNGTCKWADPIYETTRLLQDLKSRQYDDKLYKLVVGMGSSRSSILGEATINLADFVDALKPTAVSVQLNGCEAGTILHVTVQLLTSKTGFREFEQQRELREKGLQTNSDQGTNDESADSKESSPDQNVNNHINKVSAGVKFKKESKGLALASSLEVEAGMNEECADSAVGLDSSSTTSGSMYAEKHDMSSTNELDGLKCTTSGDSGGLSLTQSHQPEKGDALGPSQGSDWVQDWRADGAAANDIFTASEDTSRLREDLEAIESSILGLKLEVSSLRNHSDAIGAETLNFAEQLAAEISSGEALSKEVAVLKSECLEFKNDFEQLKNSKLSFTYSMIEPTETDEEKLFQKSQLRGFQELLLMEDKLREIQTKVSTGFHEKNSRFLDSELEALIEALQVVKQGYPGTSVAKGRESKEMASHKGEQFLAGARSESDFFQSEGMAHLISIPGFVSHESSTIDPTLEMRAKLFELLRELDESKTEREGLARKMDQMECYYEALVQELEQNQRQMMAELQNLRNEHSACLYTISSSKTEIERMHLNMKEQTLKFDEDKRILNSLNNELERRAVSAEAALKRARLNYSIAVGQLQKDLKLLSCQVLSMYETNENLIKQAFSDSSLPCPETLNHLKSLEEGLTSNQSPCQTQNALLNKQHLGEDILLKDLKQSLHLQEGLYKQVEEEACHMHFVNIYLEVFSKALQEMLLEANVDIQLMKENIDQLSQQLKLSTESKELLTLRLQNAMNDIHSLNEYKASCTARSNDIAHQNEILEASFKSLAHENHLLAQKIIELETHLAEYRSYESKFVACNAENLELKNLVKEESQANNIIHNEMSTLREELKASRSELNELVSMKDHLQSVVNSGCIKLQKVIESYANNYSGLSLCSTSSSQDLKSKDLDGLILQLDELQHSACDRIQQLIEEKKVLVNEQHLSQVSLNTAKSDYIVMKQKFEHDLQEMVGNLSTSSALLQKLQSEFEAVVNTLKASSDIEEIYSKHHKELLSVLDHLEAELQQLSMRNHDLAQEILRLDTLSGDLEKCKLSLSETTREKEALEASLQKEVEESSMISSELNALKESLHSLYDELHAEKTFRGKLEKTVTDLTSVLNEKQCQLEDFDLNKNELVRLKEMVADLEIEKSRVSELLLETDGRLKDVLRESSSISFLETHLAELHDFAIATDVVMIFTRAQLEGHIENLVEKLHSTCRQVEVLHKKNLDVESELNGFLSRESTYIEENARLSGSVDCLKSELESSTAQSRALIDQNNAINEELSEYKSRAENAIDISCEHESQGALEVERLEHLLANCRIDIEDLFFDKEEVEVKCMVFQSKLDELKSAMFSLKQSDDELIRLQIQYSELTKRLSEQVLKTEEFKNLSIHLKELKDKADAECLNARDRRGHEGPQVAMQESLRIAFIKEQYETKLQELKQQLSLSKKHSEEMLWKLQDAIDDIENRKKSEASHIKRNEELRMKILDLEAELQAVLSEKRNLLNVYDLVNAEKECSMISLECCKQEKQELEDSLLKCNEEKSRIAVELTLMKELIEDAGSHLKFLKEGNNVSQKRTGPSDEPIEEQPHSRNPISNIPTVGKEIVDKFPRNYSSVDPSSSPSSPREAKSACVGCSREPDSPDTPINAKPEEAPALGGINGCQTVETEENLQLAGQKHAALSQSLKSSLDHLNNELEKMKNENLFTSVDDCNFESSFPGLQRELMQLHEANQELGDVCPVFNEISVSGNALERVLALEIELAGALQAKKSSLQFQSSFLKQHSDEEAIFRSFRDINELIKDMLELKARHVAVETELKEMHDRYSQLSLQFAEVEGERQKLMMTLKNSRTPRRDHSL